MTVYQTVALKQASPHFNVDGKGYKNRTYLFGFGDRGTAAIPIPYKDEIACRI